MSLEQYRFALPLAALLVLALTGAPPAQAWQYTQSAGNNGFEEAFAVALNDNDHVVAAGRLFREPERSFRFFAAKVNRQLGHEIWTFELPVHNGRALDVAIGPDGHAVASGDAGGDFTVVKLDQETGAPLWVSRVAQGSAFGVELDAAGDVIAAGHSGPGTGMFVVKLDGADGSELWRADLNGASPRGQVRDLDLDHAGNAVVTGFTRNAAGQSLMTVAEVAGSDGSERWRFTIEPNHPFSVPDEGIRVEVDPAGDVVAAGNVRVFDEEANALPSELAVVKLGGDDGTLLWRHDVSSGPPSDLVRDLALDAVGDVVVGGTLGTDTGFQAAVVKLSGDDGAEAWRVLGGHRSIESVAFDAVGDVLVGGIVNSPDRFDILVRKLVGATGGEVWSSQIDGDAANGEDTAEAVAADSAGDVLVGGTLHQSATGRDFAVLKLSGETGADFDPLPPAAAATTARP